MNIDKIREDFPILQKGIDGKPIIYFDNACMTLRPNQVIEAVKRYYTEYPACGARSIHKLGKRVTEEVEKSRKILQKFIVAKEENEVIFTKNTTEGINLVTKSLEINKGEKVIITDKEHNSNLLPCQLMKDRGAELVVVESEDDNSFNVEKFREAIDKSTRLVSVVHTSNLDGTTTPADEIIKIAHENNALVMLDAAQSVPHKEINVKKLDVDFLAFSGHKMLGPSGTGILYGKKHLLEELRPYNLGGDTVVDTTYDSFELEKPPEKFEAGLQNYAGIIGLAEAARYLDKIGRKNIGKHEAKLNSIISEGLEAVKGFSLIGPKNPELRSGIVSFNLGKTDSHEIALILDESDNIMVRSGAHCVHSWFNKHNMKGSVRASLYLYNTEAEAEKFMEAVKKISDMIN